MLVHFAGRRRQRPRLGETAELSISLRPLAPALPVAVDTLVAGRGPPTAHRYFFDLRLMTGIIRASWPAAAPLTPDWIDPDVLDRHVDDLRRQVEDLRTLGRRTFDPAFHYGPPQDPVSRAHLLGLADHLLPRRRPRRPSSRGVVRGHRRSAVDPPARDREISRR